MSNWKQIIVGLGNGLAPKRQQNNAWSKLAKIHEALQGDNNYNLKNISWMKIHMYWYVMTRIIQRRKDKS